MGRYLSNYRLPADYIDLEIVDGEVYHRAIALKIDSDSYRNVLRLPFGEA
jgi:hypothetical protein